MYKIMGEMEGEGEGAARREGGMKLRLDAHGLQLGLRGMHVLFVPLLFPLTLALALAAAAAAAAV